MAKMETASQREAKIRELAKKITEHCAAVYEKSGDEKKEKMFAMLEDLEQAMIAYRNHECVWDSMLIEIPLRYDGKSRKSDQEPWTDGIWVKTKAISTFDSVMDKARDVFAFVSN